MMKGAVPQSVDEYIAMQPKNVQPVLEKIRQVIRKAAPKAEESISYQMPGYKQEGPLVYFGAFKDHYSLFPTSTPVKVFADQLKKYKSSKGTIQFSYDEPLPVKLITDIVKFKVKENLEKKMLKTKPIKKTAAKKTKKK